MFFWWICWGESGLPVLFLHHLRATSLIFSLKLALSLSFFTLIERLSSSSLLSAIRVISSTYLRLLMFFLPILILAYNSSSPAFLMMCLGYRLNKQGDRIIHIDNYLKCKWIKYVNPKTWTGWADETCANMHFHLPHHSACVCNCFILLG